MNRRMLTFMMTPMANIMEATGTVGLQDPAPTSGPEVVIQSSWILCPRPACHDAWAASKGIQKYQISRLPPVPLCLHRCQGIEEGASLGGAACQIASVSARHPHRPCSVANLRDCEKIVKRRLRQISRRESCVQNQPSTSIHHPVTLKRSLLRGKHAPMSAYEPSRSRQ